ncbi:MAG: ChaN family lipoprotein, partial [Planctomycetota bacterium]
NGVYTPRGGGNWCEALTTYCSNYYWVEKFEGPDKARDYRRKAFLRYSIFVDEKNDYPVGEFAYKRREVDDFIGYTKGSMVLHTLRGIIGEKDFFAGLREVRKGFEGKVAKWDDFRKAFEKTSGRSLTSFFEQWIDSTGAPSLSIESASIERAGEGWAVRGKLSQGGKAFRLTVPVVVTTEAGEVRRLVEMTSGSAGFEIRTDRQPVRVEADPDFEVFRRLHGSEIHPCLELTLSDDSALVVYPTGGGEKEKAFYRGIAQRFRNSGRRLPSKADSELSENDLSTRSLLVLGGVTINSVAAKLAGKLPKSHLDLSADSITVSGTRYDHKGHSALVSLVHPASPGKHITFYASLAPDGMHRARLMSHYGWESYLVYDARKPRQVLSRGNFAPGSNPCVTNLSEEGEDVFSDPAFGPGEAIVHRFADDKRITFRELIEDLSAFDVVFVGEYHNDWATHHAEYGILAGLSQVRGGMIAASMEMFERDVQKILDDFLAGRISETEFLKTSRPWGNYRVGYREVVEFAKAKGYPVLAANVPRRLASKLAREGEDAMEALSAEERKWVARETSAPPGTYKKKFLRTMGAMGGRSNPMVERIYRSQCLKDDTMAESIVDHLSKPGKGKSLVIHYNGSFHSDGHLGTVERVEKRLPGKKVVVVKIVSDRDLLSADVAPYKGDAEYLLVLRKRGEDLSGGAYSFQVSRRLRFQPVIPRGFDPSGEPRAVVAFHRDGGQPNDLIDALKRFGFGGSIILLPEGIHPVWNGDGTPGHSWFGPDPRGEDGAVLASFGAELGSFLERTYGVSPENTWFLGFGGGARAAAVCASGFGGENPLHLVAVGAPASPVVSAVRSPAVVTLVNPKGRAPSRNGVAVETVHLDRGPALFSDAVGRALREAMGFGGVEKPVLDRERTLVLSLKDPSPHGRRWAYKIQKDLEARLKSRVVLYMDPGGKVALTDVFLALHMQGVKRIVHQPLTFRRGGRVDLEFPEWAGDEVLGKLKNLPPLSWEEVLSPSVFPPAPRSRMAPRMKFVLLPSPEEGFPGADKLSALVKAAGLKQVVVVDTRKGPSALAKALSGGGGGGGMASMMRARSRTYLITGDFASSRPAAFLPAVYRHGDPDLHVRAGFGCLNIAGLIEKRLERE